MRLDEVTSIMQIWEAAKKEGQKIFQNKMPLYGYRFKGGELVIFDLVVESFIEDDPSFKDYYDKKTDQIKKDIKEKHSKGESYTFFGPFHNEK